MREETLKGKKIAGAYSVMTLKSHVVTTEWGLAVIPIMSGTWLAVVMDRCDMHIFPSNRNQTPQKLEVGNLYFLRALISVLDREMCSPRFEIEIREYVYLAIPSSCRLACSSSYYNYVSLF